MISLITCTVLGAALASFVGVLFDRLPRGESIVSPASHCAACGTFLHPWDNLPVVSWLMLRGRCRHCAAYIPLQFFVLEVIGATAGATIALTVVH
jgi:leader peptidase (prepilin peptidase)/N-methyltransferase